MTEFHPENDLIRRGDAMRAALHYEGDMLREMIREIPPVVRFTPPAIEPVRYEHTTSFAPITCNDSEKGNLQRYIDSMQPIVEAARAYGTILDEPYDPNMIQFGMFLHDVRKVMQTYELNAQEQPNTIYINNKRIDIKESIELRKKAGATMFGMDVFFKDLPDNVNFMICYRSEVDKLLRREDDG